MRAPLRFTPRQRAVLTTSLVLSGIGLTVYAVTCPSPLFVSTAQVTPVTPTFDSHTTEREIVVTTTERSPFDGHITLIRGRDARTGQPQIINVMVNQLDPALFHQANFVFPHDKRWFTILECGVTVNHKRTTYDFLVDGSPSYHCKHN